MFRFIRSSVSSTALLDSTLYDETTFYDRFARDLRRCQHEVIIESPFITSRRVNMLLPALQKLIARHVKISINTRDPETHADQYMQREAREALSKLQHMGVHVLYTDGHHRKLAIIDRSILYEGSLNILSQNDSCEVMRRIESVQLAWQMARFVKIDSFIR